MGYPLGYNLKIPSFTSFTPWPLPHLVVSVGERCIVGVHQHSAWLLLHTIEGGWQHADVRGLHVVMKHVRSHHILGDKEMGVYKLQCNTCLSEHWFNTPFRIHFEFLWFLFQFLILLSFSRYTMLQWHSMMILISCRWAMNFFIYSSLCRLKCSATKQCCGSWWEKLLLSRHCLSLHLHIQPTAECNTFRHFLQKLTRLEKQLD